MFYLGEMIFCFTFVSVLYMINMNDKIEDMVANADTKPHCMVLRTEGLVKRYGKRTVVNDVSINVR